MTQNHPRIEVFGTFPAAHQYSFYRQVKPLIDQLDDPFIACHSDETHDTLEATCPRLVVLRALQPRSVIENYLQYAPYVIVVNPGSFELNALRERFKYEVLKARTAVIYTDDEQPEPIQTPRIISMKKGDGRPSARRSRRLNQ